MAEDRSDNLMNLPHPLPSVWFYSKLDRVHLRRYNEYSEREILRWNISMCACCYGNTVRYRPGVTRLSFPYFMSDDFVTFVVEAVAMVAEYGWKLLPQVKYCEINHVIMEISPINSTSLIQNLASSYTIIIGLKKSVSG